MLRTIFIVVRRAANSWINKVLIGKKERFYLALDAVKSSTWQWQWQNIPMTSKAKVPDA